MFPTLAFADRILDPADLELRAARAATGLRSLGLGEGDVVALMLRNSPAFVEVALAARRIGAYFCPINWHFKAAETAHILTDSGAKILVTSPDLRQAIGSAVPPQLPVIDDWDSWREGHVAAQGPEARPRGMVPYTSGTTGRPKGVRRLPPPPSDAAGQTERVARLNRLVQGLETGARCLISAPLYHSAPCGYVMAAAQCGAWLRIQPRFDAVDTLATIQRERISHLYLVPTMYVRLLQLPAEVRDRYDLSSVRFVASTGSPCAPELKRAMIEWWGPVINECYASSETGYITFITSQEALERPGSVGRPAGNAVVRILDEEKRELPPGRIGTIYARQPAVPDFTYIGNDAARRAIDHDGLVSVGDMGYLDKAGYLYVCDRATDMVISGGVNIYPAEIEAVLTSMPAVADCAVFGVPDPEFGESLVAYVQPAPGAAIAPAAVQEWIRERLAGYKVPRAVHIVPALPREETGKRFKRRLREAHVAGRT